MGVWYGWQPCWEEGSCLQALKGADELLPLFRHKPLFPAHCQRRNGRKKVKWLRRSARCGADNGPSPARRSDHAAAAAAATVLSISNHFYFFLLELIISKSSFELTGNKNCHSGVVL